MTLESFKEMIDTESDNQEELLSLLEKAWNDGTVSILEYEHISSDIHMRYG